jgi:RNase H-fold protein (predicted Holliday junction resolvase)
LDGTHGRTGENDMTDAGNTTLQEELERSLALELELANERQKTQALLRAAKDALAMLEDQLVEDAPSVVAVTHPLKMAIARAS